MKICFFYKNCSRCASACSGKAKFLNYSTNMAELHATILNLLHFVSAQLISIVSNKYANLLWTLTVSERIGLCACVCIAFAFRICVWIPIFAAIIADFSWMIVKSLTISVRKYYTIHLKWGAFFSIRIIHLDNSRKTIYCRYVYRAIEIKLNSFLNTLHSAQSTCESCIDFARCDPK